MMGFGSLLRRGLAALLASFLLIGVSDPGIVYTVRDEDACRTAFTVLSDVHMEGNNKASRDAFITELYDVRNNSFGNDALVLLGDNTMNGQHIENLFLYGILNRIQPAGRVLLTLGNHDTGNGTNRYRLLVNRFYTYYNDFYGEGVSSPYYAREINGYSFIFMGSEDDDVNSPVITENQLAWLDEQLESASGDGKPVFLFCHHPFERLEEQNAWMQVVGKYQNVFFFTGHMHGESITVETLEPGVYQINLPRVTELNEEDAVFELTGQGVNVEVYDGTVLIRERNYFTSQWMEEISIPLQ